MSAAARALRLVNCLLAPAGLALRSLAEEQRRAEADTDMLWGYWRAAKRAQEREEQARVSVDVAKADKRRAWAAAEQLRRHLLALDELVHGHSTEMRAARRILDVALGRDEERAA